MQNENLTSPELTDHLAQLTSAKNESDEAFVLVFLALKEYERANVITELPDIYQKELCRKLSDKKLASFVNLMRTDDATDLMIILKEVDEAKCLDDQVAFRPTEDEVRRIVRIEVQAFRGLLGRREAPARVEVIGHARLLGGVEGTVGRRFLAQYPHHVTVGFELVGAMP